jgi:proteasome lid subunit RPN8/RPN11
MSIQWTDTSPKAHFNLAQWRYPALLASSNLPNVVVTDGAFAQALEHLNPSPYEQGGLLLGRVFRSHELLPADQFDCIEIIEAIAAKEATGTEFTLRMKAQVWQAANDRCEQLNLAHDDKLRVVGWYHSHPNLGAFFSATDCQTQAAFFNHDYSVGLVIDPVRHQLAGFIGRLSAPLQFVPHAQLNWPRASTA